MLELFFTFFKIGSFTFGGGYAMIPLIEREIIEHKRWIEEEELMDIIAISQMTPGVIAVNSAAFVGKKVKGTTGALIAVLGVILPSLIIITLIVQFLSETFQSPEVIKVLTGVRACVVALIMKSFLRMFRSNINPIFLGILFLFAISMLVISVLQPLEIVLIGACIGIPLYVIFPNFTKKIMNGGKE